MNSSNSIFGLIIFGFIPDLTSPLESQLNVLISDIFVFIKI